MEIRPVGAEFHTDRQTDMTKLIAAFPSFGNVPKNISSYLTENTTFPITTMYF